MEKQKIDAAYYAERISNCCRMLCSPKLPPTPTGEPPPQLVLCANLLGYLCEMALIHKFKEDTSFFGRQKPFEIFSAVVDGSTKDTKEEREAFADAISKARGSGKTDQGRIRIFIRVLVNSGYYVSFIQSMNMRCELLEKHYEPDAFIRDFEAVEEVSMSMNTLTSHVKVCISTNDADINSKDYWENRPDSVNFNPDNVYAKRTVLALIADDNPQLLEIQGILSTHIRQTKFDIVRHATAHSQALLIKKDDIPLMIEHSRASEALLRCLLTPQTRHLSLSSSESRSLILEKSLSLTFHGKYVETPKAQSLMRTSKFCENHSMLVSSSIAAQSLLRSSAASKLPVVCRESQALLECSLNRKKFVGLYKSSKHSTALLAAKDVLLISELSPQVDASQSVLKSILYHKRLESLRDVASIPSQSLIQRANASARYNKLCSASIKTQSLIRRNKECAKVDFTKLFTACRDTQSLIRSRRARSSFREKADASEIFQASVKGGTACVKFLLKFIAAEMAQGLIRSQSAQRHRLTLEKTIFSTQVLFAAAVKENCVYKRGLRSIVYVQNVLIDRKNERSRAKEKERIVASRMKEAASRGESLTAALEDYEVDLSNKGALPKRRPEWVPDSESKTCFLCGKAFSFGNRRHHCRNCGKLVCTQCTVFMPLPHLEYYKPVRVCKSCKVIILANK